MLVSQELADKMYSKSGFLYKSFARLFKNSLWQKSVPGGFSICPFFWLSLLSLMVFTPFIHLPVKLLVKPIFRIFKTLCKLIMVGPLVALDNFIISKVNNQGDRGTGVALGIIFLGVVIGYVLTTQAVIGTGLAGFIIPFIAIQGLLLMGFISHVYKFNRHANKALHWIYPALFCMALIAASLIWAPYTIPALFSGIAAIIIALYNAVVGIIGIIVYLVVLVSTWLAATAVDIFVIVKPVLPLLLTIGGSLMALGWIIEKYFTEFESKKDHTEAWKDHIAYKLLDINGYGTTDSIQFRHAVVSFSDIKTPTKSLAKYVNIRMAYLLTESYFGAFFEKVKNINPTSISNYGKTKKYDLEFTSEYVGVLTPELYKEYTEICSELYEDLDKFEYNSERSEKLSGLISDYDKVLEAEVYVTDQIRNYKIKVKNESKRQAAIDEWCENFCNRVTKVIDPVKTKLSLVKQWMSLGWSLLKDRKKNVCPYFTFKD